MQKHKKSVEKSAFAKEIDLLYSSTKTNLLNNFQCSLCLMVFSSLEVFKTHLRTELEFGREADEFLTSECCEDEISEPSKRPAILTQENDTEIKKRKCPNCSRMLKGFKGLEQHIAKTHAHIKKKSICKSCGKYFKNKYAMLFHLKQVHEKSTRVVCEICQKVAYNKYSLITHIEKYHSNAHHFSQ